MTLRQYLLMMTFGTALAAVTAWFILLSIDPEQIGAAAAAAFLLSVSLTATGALALLGVLARLYLLRTPGLLARHVRVSFRQGALASLVLLIALELNHLELFAWWSMLLAISGAAIAEYFFLSSEGHAQEELFDIGS